MKYKLILKELSAIAAVSIYLALMTACNSEEDSISVSVPVRDEIIIKNADASSSAAFFTLHIQSPKSEPKICSSFTPQRYLPDIALLFDGALKIDRLSIKVPMKSQETLISFDQNATPSFSFEAYESYSLCAEHDGEIEEDQMVFVQIPQGVEDDDAYLGSAQEHQARFSRTCIGCRFTGDLTNNSFDGVNLTGSTFNGAILPVNLDNAIFDRVDFSGVTTKDRSKQGYIVGLVDVSLNGSSLKGAKLPRRFSPKSINYASFADVDFAPRHDFRGLEPSVIKGVDFRGAKLQHASFQHLTIEGSAFDGSDLSGASFDSVEWRGSNTFRGATTQGANFITSAPNRPPVVLNTLSTVSLKQDYSDQDVSHLSFVNANYSESNFSYAKELTKNLDRAILNGVDFTGVAMTRVSLNGSSLNGAKLPVLFSPLSINGASFVNVDFGTGRNFSTINPKLIKNVNFQGAKLVEANFEGLTIEGCNFNKADLSGANFAAVTFRGENTFLGATMDELTNATFKAKEVLFTKPSPKMCSDKGGIWVSEVGECVAPRAIAKTLCRMPTKDDWREVLASCGANIYHSSGYTVGLDSCMISKHFADPLSDTYTGSYWSSTDANSKESWVAGYRSNIWGVGISYQSNRDSGWIRCAR